MVVLASDEACALGRNWIGARLGDDRPAVVRQRVPHVGGDARRIARVVQRVEHGDEVVASALVVLGGGHAAGSAGRASR